jgi:hypothetical protein
MKRKQFYKIWGIFCLVGIIGVSVWFYHKVPAHSYYNSDEIKDSYLKESYNGEVIDKYIDEDQHNYHKIILNEEGNQRTILMDWEKGGLFNIVQVGDTLQKKSDKLEVRLKRKNIDTIIKMLFYNSKE